MRTDVLVIGAGPAGAAAARALARAGVAVRMVERGAIGRPRLCGEFVSPEAGVDLAALGLAIGDAGGVAIGAAGVTAGGASTETMLAPPGHAVGRDVLDAWMAKAAVESGATLHAATSVAALQGDAADGFRAELEGDVRGTLQARLVIGAFGRRAPGWLGIAPVSPRRAAIALKAHLRVGPEALPSRVALHAFPGGYIGSVPIAADRINLCLVAERRAAGALAPGGARAALAAFVAHVPELGALWERAELAPASVCAASGLRFGHVHPTHGDILLAGDAAGQPHPASGDGIAMALRSGRLAAACACAVLERRLAPDRLARFYTQAWRREFAARLRWARLVHAAIVRPRFLGPALVGLAREPHVVQALLARTRGAPHDVASPLALHPREFR